MAAQLELSKHAQETKLTTENTERILERFGFASIPYPTLENLNGIYKAWCRQVGYDNVQKRVYYARGETGPFPVMDPNDFVETFLKHNTGGSCWPTSEAMFGILVNCGYDVERVSAEMLDCGDPMRPNHGTCLIRLDGKTYVADTGMVGEDVLELADGVETSTPSPAFGTWSKGDGRIWWRPGHSRQAIEVDLLDRNCTYDFFEYRYEKTKEFSLFNHSLYVRKNIDDGIVTYGRGNVIKVDPQGEMTAQPIDEADIPALLIDVMGLSEEIVSLVPVRDEEGAKFDK